MTVLAIDTSTLISSIAIAVPGRILAELTLDTGKTHSEQLMPYIASILQQTNLTPATLQAVAVSIGPGSFTGLRIGLATAKALSYALKIPLLGIPTLTALAYNIYAPGATVVPLLDAQKRNVYYALYHWHEQQLATDSEAEVVAIDDLLTQLAARPEPVIVMGEAAIIYQKQITAYPQLSLPPANNNLARAGSVALLALERWRQNQVDDVETLEPLYIRRSAAEVLWEQRQEAIKHDV